MSPSPDQPAKDVAAPDGDAPTPVDSTQDANDNAPTAEAAPPAHTQQVTPQLSSGPELPDESSAPNDEVSAGQPDAADDVVESSTSGIDPEDETSRIDVIQADPSTPYHSATSFEELGLSEDLMKGIYYMKFAKPSKIQASSLPLILPADGEYKNLIAQGHNGSGKTACFVLAMLSRVDYSSSTPQALCLVPTRELARQIESVIMSLGKFTPVKVKLAVKSVDGERGYSRSDSVPVKEHIVVGTPGKVMEIIKKRLFVTSNVQILVLDEADEMVDAQGMGDQTIRIKKTLPSSAQVLLFSATYNDEVQRIAKNVAPRANHISVKRETLSLDKVAQFFIHTGSRGARFDVITEIYELLTVGLSIIFVRTRATAADLTTRLRAEGQSVSVLYGGSMAPEERDKVIDEFRQGTTRVLVTTNVLSRGVDISAVTTVINYDLPMDRTGSAVDAETYLHRIGRTGRFGRKGIAINFVYDDHSLRLLRDLERYYSKKIEEVTDVEDLSERLRRT